MSLRTANKTIRRSARTPLVILTACAAMASTTLAGEQEANASISSDVGSNVVATFVSNAISCALTDGFQSIFSSCVLTGGSSSQSGLTDEDIENISDAVKADLVNFAADSYASQADTILGYVQNYYRGTSCSDLNATDSGALWKVNQILDWTDNVMALAASDSMGLSGASTYFTLAPIQVAFYKEKYEIMRLLNEGGCTAYTNGALYSTAILANALSAAADHASDAATQLEAYNDLVDDEFTAVEKVTSSTTKGQLIGSTYVTYTTYTNKYCFTGPSGTTCGDSQSWTTSNYGNSESENTSLTAKSKMQASAYRMQQMMAYRKEYIGTGVDEAIRAFQKAGDSLDFEYCGNGTCAIGEIDSCSTDCGSGTSAKWIEKSTGYSTSTDGNIMGAGGSTDATLKLASGVLSVYDNWLGRTRWSSKASQFSGTTSTLSFGTDGNLTVKSSTGTTFWESDTTATSAMDLTNEGYRMVLLGKQMYMLNYSGATVWASDKDPLVMAETNETFCYDLPSSDETILSVNPYVANSTTTTYEKKLVWTTTGALVVKEGSTQKWSSGTSGTGAWLCHQEDGNLVVYSETGTAVWYAKKGSTDMTGRIQLVDDQVRVTTASGDVRWGSSTCSYDTCGYAVRKQSTGYSLTKSTSDQTVLGSGKAKLIFTSTGDLQIQDRTTGSTLWSAGTSGTGNTLSFSTSGILSIANSSGTTVWTATSTTGTHLYLADCSMYIGNGSNTSVYWAGTECEDVSSTLTVTGSDGTKTYTTAQVLSLY